MSVLNQKTIKEPLVFDGIGLHSGKKVHIEIKPAKPNTGIVFKRTDIKNNNIVIPGIFNVSNAALRSVDYKGGIDFYLKNVKAFKLSPKAKKLKNKIAAKA